MRFLMYLRSKSNSDLNPATDPPQCKKWDPDPRQVIMDPPPWISEALLAQNGSFVLRDDVQVAWQYTLQYYLTRFMWVYEK